MDSSIIVAALLHAGTKVSPAVALVLSLINIQYAVARRMHQLLQGRGLVPIPFNSLTGSQNMQWMQFKYDICS
eukprot:1775373-Amphidinium_carterae.3